MEGAGCIFYPDDLVIRPMQIDGTPDMSEGVAVDVREIDIADMGEFTQDQWQTICQAIRANRPAQERKEIDSIKQRWEKTWAITGRKPDTSHLPRIKGDQ